MAINAVSAVRHVVEEYKRFLRTSYRFADEHLKAQFEEHLRQMDVVVRGPYVTLARDFLSGRTLGEIVAAGEAHKDQLRAHWAFGDNPLFVHQEKALLTGRDGRCFMATTGTGSGKTEAFLLPMFEHILTAKARGAEGVKAILIYPMNALANDQLERMRRLLRSRRLDISFGLYTGDSDVTTLALKEPPVEGLERTTRAAIRNSPPDILLTNYKQMEFLLIRREDRVLFTPSLRVLVLDEIHSYRGALATEIACLIRRLKAGAGLRPGLLLCIGTSATAAEGQEGLKRLAAFGSDLFGEPFGLEDILQEEYAPRPPEAKPAWTPPAPALAETDLTELKIDDEAAVTAFAEKLTGRSMPAGPDLVARITNLLAGNNVVVALEEELEKPRAVLDVAARLKERLPERADLPDEQVALEVEGYLLLGSIGDEDRPPRLRPKLHLFCHGLYDVGICTNRTCRKLVPHGGAECPDCHSLVLPAAICRTCGQDFVKVKFKGEDDDRPVPDDSWTSSPNSGFFTPKVHTFASGDGDGNGNGDDRADDGLDGSYMCPKCGKLGGPGACDACGVERAAYRLLRGKANTCPACGSVYTRGDIITPLRTGTASTVSVLASRQLDGLEGDDRKLLVFADNRQDTAHQAGYMADRERMFAIRHLVARYVREAGSGGLALDDLPERLIDGMRDLGVIPRKITRSEREKWLYVIRHDAVSEFCRPTHQRVSLENLGLVAVGYEFLDDALADDRFRKLAQDAGLDATVAGRLVRAMLDRMRRQRAVTYDFFQEYVDPKKRKYRELEAEPYCLSVPDRGRKPIGFALDRPSSYKKARRLEGIIQENPKAGRLPALHTLARRVIGTRPGAEAFLRGLVPLLVEHEVLAPVKNFPIPKRERVPGVIPLQIASRVLRLREPAEGYRCGACQVWRAYDFPCCPTPNCTSGGLQQTEPDKDNYYLRLYLDQIPQRLAVREHSAQVSAEDRAERETDFKEGNLDVLVCTPTLELGVDIGPLLTVALRNAPPTPANYSQRVGRAGRRLRIGFATTFCGPGPHDRHAFERPTWLVAGEFRPPTVRLDNPRIVCRHLRSFVLENIDSALPQRMGDLLDDTQDPGDWNAGLLDDVFAEIEQRRNELIAGLVGLFADDRRLGRTERFDEDESTELVDEFKPAVLAKLYRWWARVDQLNREFKEYSKIGSPRHDERKAKARKRAFYEITLDPRRAYCLNYLSEAGLLPSYQFPTDTFLLDPGVEDTPTLQRPAVIALQEFAPGNLVYANGHKLRSIRALFAGGPGAARGGAGGTDMEASGRVRSFYFCDKCGAATEDVSNNCRTCGQPLGSEVPVVFLDSFEAEEATKITSEEEARERRLFLVKETLLEAPDAECALYDYPFAPLEHRMHDSILVTNWGRPDPETGEGERFLLCPECGRHKPHDVHQDQRKSGQWDEYHAKFCTGHPGSVVLGYEFPSDVLVVSVPDMVPPDPAEPGQASPFLLTLAEALLVGATEDLEVEPQELRAFVRQASRMPQIVLYETVPGGAGYLKEMAQRLPSVAKAAAERLFGHDCRRACYRCLKRYGNQRIHRFLDKELVRDFLFGLGTAEAPEPAPVQPGEGSKKLTKWLQDREGEGRRLRESGQVGAGPQSPIESKLLEAIRAREDLPEPVCQHPIPNAEHPVTIPDFAYPGEKVAVFCDGYQYHGDPDTLELDARKRNYLQTEGWLVLTFWGRTILQRPEACAEQIAAALRSKTG